MSNSPTPSEDSPLPSPYDAGEDEGDIPLTLTASTLLTELPPSATTALAETTSSQFPVEKVVVRFKAVGNAPALRQEVCRISSDKKFEEVVRYLRRKLRVDDGGGASAVAAGGGSASVFLYVNSAFAPSLDEVVGNLWMCFKNANDQLVVAYSITPAFG